MQNLIKLKCINVKLNMVPDASARKIHLSTASLLTVVFHGFAFLQVPTELLLLLASSENN